MSGMEKCTQIHSIIKRSKNYNDLISRLVMKSEKEKSIKKTSDVVEYKGLRYIIKIEIEPKNDKYFREHENVIYHLDPLECEEKGANE